MAGDVRRGLALLVPLHRDPEAAVAFTGPVDGRWHRFFGLLPSELADPSLSVPQLAALETNRFVTINGMLPAKGRSRCDPFRDKRAGRRSDDEVAALNAVWVDFDCYKRGLTPEQVSDEQVARRDTGELPPWSLAIHSGRGLWLVWLLRRDESELPPKATDENKVACVSINHALASRFANLGADPASINLGRVTRVPESINSKAVGEGKDGVVIWDYAAPPPFYTIAEMSAAFAAEQSGNVEKRRRCQRAYAQTRPAWVDRGTHQAKRAPRGRPFHADNARGAVRCRWGSTAMDLLALWVVRDGYKRGQRNHALFWIALLLKLAWPSERGKADEIQRICREVNERFKPPLSVSEVEGQIAKGLAWFGKGFISNRELAAKFDVTQQEAALLRKLKPAAMNRREMRRAALVTVRADWVDAKGKDPTIDELTRELEIAGHCTSRSTVARDLHALETPTEPSTPRSPLEQGTSAKNETARRGTARATGKVRNARRGFRA